MLPGIRHTPAGKRLEQKLAAMESEGFVPSIINSFPTHPLSSSVSADTEVSNALSQTESHSGSSSTRMTSPERERDAKLRPSVSAPPSMINKGGLNESVSSAPATNADTKLLEDLLK
jgi:hypothetical protein